ncbi:hypothetical protein [Sneathiella sp. HT1-7]|uniref:hypothetical protein n=1 Tax=Sneathiella sp. HT1-7 TaxID=2887192 RepID=UPI001D15C01C|nr:hypothetical protein [Sneathiella sp. HT1-7]MCC3304943.1 hypothetical protein [Sneathiella sp. HT1-7]
MIIQDLRELIVRPTLNALHMGGVNAENLILGTGLVESGFRHLRQIRGPALGFYQCEPATYDDILHYLGRRPALLRRLRLLMAGEGVPKVTQLVWNLKFATAICRIHYWRKPGAIPDNLEGQAAYWKCHYNTALGRGTVEKYLESAHPLTEGITS